MTQTTRRLLPPRIFVEVVREIEGGGAVRSRKEIDVGAFQQARFGMAEHVINKCLAEIRLYDP